MDELLQGTQAPSDGAPTGGSVQNEASIAASSFSGLQLSASQLGALGRSSQTQEVAKPSKTGDAVFQTEQIKPVEVSRDIRTPSGGGDQAQSPLIDFQPKPEASAPETTSNDLR
jgi:hypothetical protein